ncbi:MULTISPECIES: TetR/AcrR family transcriptional regulator [Klebsiella]|uniref:TetR/AcrR family transcriptional regulator n=1 Tax=Klebsiella TaxID=570 RepID=UPI0021E1DB60|nr:MULTISPECIES: TetR/AcrR family transcriptional regulator [Klebsiella]MCV0446495.1 TetR/AcrR family transcriptional regulator [Klebsiella pneumoniae]MEB5699433.1 TetR/AcrR family transcriptional regulator [Klebsiella aerogenes]HBR1235571.1 TetR/AcrR family transcriptional regulator [Klebsiella pneumoniae]HBR1600491.1 TetR/AcrR family transcriptional regulator [Klebsiella quasipneumoniae subsp. quasipneumoniae]
MARHKEFDRDTALDSAISIFREHGFEGTSTGMLVKAMGIGRQSLYDTFGDKWQLYQSALQRYSVAETMEHTDALKKGPRAIDGIRAVLDRVVESAGDACLGVNSICEFGRSKPELVKIQDTAAHVLRIRLSQAIEEARLEGNVSDDVNPDEAASFLIASIAGIRIAARGGSSREQLQSLGRMALRAIT